MLPDHTDWDAPAPFSPLPSPPRMLPRNTTQVEIAETYQSLTVKVLALMSFMDKHFPAAFLLKVRLREGESLREEGRGGGARPHAASKTKTWPLFGHLRCWAFRDEGPLR